MILTKKQLKQIIKEEIGKIMSEGMEVPQGEDLFDMLEYSQPGDLIYYGISGLNKMKNIVEKEIIETEEEFNIFHYGNNSWAEDNIIPLQEMYDKIVEAMKIAVDMGFGES